MQYAWESQTISLKVHGYLRDELKYPAFTRSVATRKNQNIRTAIRNPAFGFWIIYVIYKHTNFIFPKRALVRKGLNAGAFNWRAYIRVKLWPRELITVILRYLVFMTFQFVQFQLKIKVKKEMEKRIFNDNSIQSMWEGCHTI